MAVAHGQMDEGTLERVVLDFWERLYDVLVCTTIIESGIDMPSVNTLVVDRADLLGLGQLHQIRGRVGRAAQRAYAYLFHPADRVLTEQAYERLRTIGEHTELGSGFKIAMRDLQIRGAGNLLGRDQSGHIAAVGYDLYVQLVAEAVAEARGQPRREPPSVSLDVPGDAHLPADYVAAEDARLEAYRRLAAALTGDDVDDIGREWLDRFGPLPPAAQGLLELARLRVECLRVGVTEVAVAPARIGGERRPIARLSPVVLPASAQVRLHRLAPDGALREQTHQLVVPIDPRGPAATQLRQLLAALLPDDAAPAAPLAAANMPGACRRALLFLVVLAAAVAVAAFDVPSDAATVNGVGISRATLNSDLGVIEATPTYQCYLSASLALQSQNLAMLPSIGGAGGAKTVNTRFADFWLSQLVNNELIDQLAADRHLPVTKADLAAGKTDLVNSISATLTAVAQDSGQQGVCAPDGSSILGAVPPAFAARLVASQAAGDVVLAAAAGYGLAPAQLASFYTGHRSDFDTLCLSAIETASEAAATSARAAIEGGLPFALVAQANSTDATSAADGGAIGCFAPTDPAYGSVTSDTKGLAVGVVSQPKDDAGNYILLEITARRPTSFAAAGDAVRGAVLAAGAKAADRELKAMTKRAHVTIDPRYGQWGGGAAITVVPPVHPPTSALLNPAG